MVNILAEAFITLFKRMPIKTPTGEVYQQSVISSKSNIAWVVGGVLAVVFLISGFVIQGFFGYMAYLAFSLLPVIVLLGWLLKTDRYEPEPKSLVLAVIGVGIVVSAVYRFIRFPLGIASYLVRLVVLELIFFFILYMLDANRTTGREFNDHLDGAIYGLSLGLGYTLYDNFHILTLGMLVKPAYVLLLSLEELSLAMFPALTGWWIGYVKAKYVSISFGSVFAGFIPVVVLKIFYVMIFTYAAVFELAARLIIALILGLLALSILGRRVSWAVMDELAWGYAAGKAPVEKTG